MECPDGPHFRRRQTRRARSSILAGDDRGTYGDYYRYQ